MLGFAVSLGLSRVRNRARAELYVVAPAQTSPPRTRPFATRNVPGLTRKERGARGKKAQRILIGRNTE